jgi:hypothetical protein
VIRVYDEAGNVIETHETHTQKMKGDMKYITLALALMLVGCATPSLDVPSASTDQLLERRAEIDRKLREDDLGVAWATTRWISHAAEKNSVLKERAAIDAELARRHVTPRKTPASSSETAPQ